jgi:predicted nuclease of predicted toxin-antitoxin system
MSVGFLADECLHQELVLLLMAAGWDIATLSAAQRSSRDPIVLQVANEHGRVLLTHDFDFGEMLVKQLAPAIGVAIIQMEIFSRVPAERPALAARALYPLKDRLIGFLTIIGGNRIRSRPVPVR